MTIEENIFKHCEFSPEKLREFGFEHSDKMWQYSALFMDGEFKAVIGIDDHGNVSGNVYETATCDIFLPLRVESMGGFAGEVRNAYIDILKKIKENCGRTNVFISAQANRLAQNIYKKYGDKPVFPWDDFSGGVFKNPDNGKWYALVMNLNVQKVDKNLCGNVDAVNIKLQPEKIRELHNQKGFYPAYHMNKKNWITILLNDSIADEILFELIDESHNFTLRKSNKLGHK